MIQNNAVAKPESTAAVAVVYDTWPYDVGSAVKPTAVALISNTSSGPVAMACTQAVCPGDLNNVTRNKANATISPMRFAGPPSSGTIVINGKTALIFSPADSVTTDAELAALASAVARTHSTSTSFTVYGVIGMPGYTSDMLVAVPV
jgi:hypothetical protein